jgi:uncharacterized membrane protein
LALFAKAAYTGAMKTNTAGIIMFALTAISFAAGLYVYPHLPAQIVSHWNGAGEPNGALPKIWGIFLWPTVILAVFALWSLIPVLEPLESNLKEFRRSYNLLFLILELFFCYGFALVLTFDLGHNFNLAQYLAPALAALLVAIGILLKDFKRNFFVGIRTPWTLSSDEIWHKTHQLGATLLYICAACVLAASFVPQLLLTLTILPLIVTAFVTVIYSYVEFRHERV